jgi:hypothetical protein
MSGKMKAREKGQRRERRCRGGEGGKKEESWGR